MFFYIFKERHFTKHKFKSSKAHSITFIPLYILFWRLRNLKGTKQFLSRLGNEWYCDIVCFRLIWDETDFGADSFQNIQSGASQRRVFYLKNLSNLFQISRRIEQVSGSSFHPGKVDGSWENTCQKTHFVIFLSTTTKLCWCTFL